MLSELGFLTEDEQKTHGDLPDEIVEAVRRLQLDTDYLSASLRGYQSFGARFALVQRKVIISDEMGLGKTVEALDVLAHLRANGDHHSMVLCPAAVVTNWVREISGKSSLGPHRVHGPGREVAARNWVRNGGVAVTTFETLGWFEDQIRAVGDLVAPSWTRVTTSRIRPRSGPVGRGGSWTLWTGRSCSPEPRWRTASMSSATLWAICART